jgi:hypothetical protein
MSEGNRNQGESTPNIEFLYQSYSNTMQVIQFFDTKAGAYIVIIGILASLLVSSIVRSFGEISKQIIGISEYILLVLIGLGLLAFLYQMIQVFYQAFKVLLPRSGLDLVKKGKAGGLFWAGNITEHLRDYSLDNYMDTIRRMSVDDIVNEVAYECAKVSEITRIKLKHLEKATESCKISIFLWAILLIVVNVVEVLLPYIV